MLNGKLEMVRTKNSMEKEFGEFRRSRILHYTVGSFKPWDWYAPAIFPFTHYYTNVADRLPKTQGDQRQLIYELLWVALGLAICTIWTAVLWNAPLSSSLSVNGVSHRQMRDKPRQILSNVLHQVRQSLTPSNTSTNGTFSWTRDPVSRGALILHLLSGYFSLLLGVGTGLAMVPTNTHSPTMGFTIFLLWTFGVFFSTYTLYLYRWYLLGITFDTSKSVEVENGFLSTPRTASRQGQSLTLARTESMVYAGVLVLLVVWFVVTRIRTPTESLGQVLPPLIGLVVSLVLGLTVVFYRLPLLWYQEGLST
jgi:hypothetical protein